MALINQVNDMRRTGRSDSEIVANLRERGFTPKEIDDALSQSQVKAAISQPEYQYGGQQQMQASPRVMEEQAMGAYPGSGYPSPNQTQQAPQQQNMASQYPSNQQQYSAPPQAPEPQQEEYVPQPYSQEQYSEQQGNYSQDTYQPTDYSGGSSSDVVLEIAEQLVEQKFSKIRKDIEKVEDIKSELDNQILSLKERVKRIENIIDTLQDSIIRKIGEYGENIQDLGNDLKTTQESFSKVIAPLLETEKEKVRTTSKRKK